MHPRVVLGALVAGALTMAICAPRPAVACGGAMMDEATYVERAIAKRALIERAQNDLEGRRFADAADALRRASPFHSEAMTRGRRIFAQLVVRSDGAYDRWASLAGDPETNIKHAIAALAALPKDDPRTLTALGEALSKDESQAGQARAVLEELAHRDLMTSAEGWAALARLRNDATSEAALVRCRRMALDATASCGAVPANASEYGES